MSEDDSEEIIYTRTLTHTGENKNANVSGSGYLPSPGGENTNANASGIGYLSSPGGTGENTDANASGRWYLPPPGSAGVAEHAIDNTDMNVYLPQPLGPENTIEILCQRGDIPTMTHSGSQQYDHTVVLHEPTDAFIPSGTVFTIQEYVVAIGQRLFTYSKQ